MQASRHRCRSEVGHCYFFSLQMTRPWENQSFATIQTADGLAKVRQLLHTITSTSSSQCVGSLCAVLAQGAVVLSLHGLRLQSQAVRRLQRCWRGRHRMLVLATVRGGYRSSIWNSELPCWELGPDKPSIAMWMDVLPFQERVERGLFEITAVGWQKPERPSHGAKGALPQGPSGGPT